MEEPLSKPLLSGYFQIHVKIEFGEIRVLVKTQFKESLSPTQDKGDLSLSQDRFKKIQILVKNQVCEVQGIRVKTRVNSA